MQGTEVTQTTAKTNSSQPMGILVVLTCMVKAEEVTIPSTTTTMTLTTSSLPAVAPNSNSNLRHINRRSSKVVGQTAVGVGGIPKEPKP